MEENIKIKNFKTFTTYLKSLIGEDKLTKLIDYIGGEEQLMNCSFGMNKSSGLAYDGAMIEQSINIAKYAASINDLLPEGKRVIPSKIWKVALLSHISKAMMYTENQNEWEKANRGIMYVFRDRDIMLKGGELSAFISMSCGVELSEDEFEAMRIIDKVKEEGNSVLYSGCTLSMLIRQANEIINRINKE